MNIKRKHRIVSLMTVFVMVFTMIPNMGFKSNVVNAAEAVKDTFTTEQISNANGACAFTKSFKADTTNYMKLDVNRGSYMGESGYQFKVEVVDSTGKVITSKDSSGGIVNINIEKFPKADTYTIKLYSQHGSIGYSTYNLAMDLGLIKIYTYKYKTATAKVTDGKTVRVEFDCYDGDDFPIDTAIYKEYVATGKFVKLTSFPGVYVDTNTSYATKYRYYGVNLNRLSASTKAALPTETSKTITSSAKSELTKKGSVVTVTTGKPTLTKITDLKYTKMIKKAKISWNYKLPNGLSSDTKGYIIEKKVPGSSKYVYVTKFEPKNFNSLFYIDKTITIPYENATKGTIIRVTPYTVVNDTTYKGQSATIKCYSAKVKPAGGFVTKIKSTKAKITALKAQGAYATQIQQKKDSKWVTVVSGSKSKTVLKTWTKNKAGNTSYRFRSVIKDNGKTFYSNWQTYKPKSNVRTYTNWGVSYLRDLHGLNSYWYPSKISYSGNKIKVSGKFTNTWRYASASCKVKVTFKVNGKTIGYKTISSGRIGPSTQKSVSFYLDKAVKE